MFFTHSCLIYITVVISKYGNKHTTALLIVDTLNYGVTTIPASRYRSVLALLYILPYCIGRLDNELQ